MDFNNFYHQAHQDRLKDAGIEIYQPTNLAIQVAKHIHQQHQSLTEEQSLHFSDNSHDKPRNRLLLVATAIVRLFGNS